MVAFSGLSGRAESERDRTGPLQRLGEYERRAVRKVLLRRGLEVVRQPDGRSIERVHIATLPVFSERDGPLQWLNRFHVTTRPEVVRREVLLEPGSRWQQDLADETERNLQDFAFSSVAVVLPVVPRQGDSSERASDTSSDRPIEVLVVTRDIWSLRLNTQFEYQNGTLSLLFLQLTESNFLGRRKQLSANFDMDLGSYSVAPSYYDPQVLGSHWQLFVTGGPVFTRDTGDLEGSTGSFQLAYPIWNLDRHWGGQLNVTLTDRVVRRFVGSELRTYDAPGTAQTEEIPQRYDLTDIEASARGTYAFGEAVRHEVSGGYRVAYQQPDLVDGGIGDAEAEAAFRRDIMPRDETLSGPLVAYELFRPTYVTYRNVDTYDLPETLRTGPFLQLEAAPALRAFGSTSDLTQTLATAGYRLDLFERAYLLAEVSGEARVDGSGWYDILAQGTFRVAGPVIAEVFRPVTRASASMLVDDGQNRLLVAGGQSGLRGYPIGALSGTRRLRFNAELRSQPIEVWTIHAGAVAFWDGAAIPEDGGSWRDTRLFHNVGLGLRYLIPQANTIPLRIDWAVPIAPEGLVFPGRLSIGFGQGF